MVTLYATLGEDAIAHGLNETEASIVVTTHDLLPKVKNILHRTPKVKIVIYMEDQLHPTDTKGVPNSVQMVPFKTVLESGADSHFGKCAEHKI